MNQFDNFTVGQLQEELDRRTGTEWPKHTTVEIDYPWDDMDQDVLAEELGWDIFSEDTIAEKIAELEMPGCIRITFAVHRNNDVKIVAINGMKVIDEQWGIEKFNGSVA